MKRKHAVILLAACGVIVGVVAWFFVRPGPQDHMDAFVAELRARGEPVTVADMEPPLPPDAENGALELDAACRWLETQMAEVEAGLEYDWQLSYAGPATLDLEQPWHEHATAEQLDELRALLVRIDPLFERLAASVEKREIAWPLAATPPRASLGSRSYPEGSTDAHGLAQRRAVVAEDSADRIDAIAWILAHPRRVRAQSTTDYFLIEAFRRGACEEMRDGVEAGRLEPVALRARVDELLREPRVSPFPRALRAERAELIAQFGVLLDGSAQAAFRTAVRRVDSGLTGRQPSRWERVGDAVHNALAGVRFDWRGYMELLRDLDAVIPGDGSWTAADEAALAEFEKRHPELSALPIRVMVRGAEAAEGLARVALAACEHRQVHGVWPEKSSDLSPLFPGGVPVDPFTGSPFVLIRDGSGLVVRTGPPFTAWTRFDDAHEAGFEWRLPAR